MRIRLLAPFLAVAVLACTAETADQAEDTAMVEETQEPADTQEYASEEDAAALAAVFEYYETHYNMGHGSMVADVFQEDGLFVSGVSGIVAGREAIAEAFQGNMDSASPQVDIEVDDQMIAGDLGVARGTFSYEPTAEGATGGASGYWMSLADRTEDGWKLRGIVSNVDSEQERPNFTHADLPPGEGDMGTELVADGAEYYQTHFNMGHPDMVAARYAEDAVAMMGGRSAVTGREAIAAALKEYTDQGAQLTISPWAAEPFGEDMVVGLGTFTMELEGQTAEGHYTGLYRVLDDGTTQIVWALTSVNPPAM